MHNNPFDDEEKKQVLVPRQLQYYMGNDRVWMRIRRLRFRESKGEEDHRYNEKVRNFLTNVPGRRTVPTG